jgi:hypothetical protein
MIGSMPTTKKIAINLNTAHAIGFKIPRGLMQVADEVYE